MASETIFYILGLVLGFVLGYAVKSLREKQSVSVQVITNKMADKIVKNHTPDKDVKPQATYVGYNAHDCEAFYRCPVCGKTFGTWSVDMKDVHCPHCNTALDGVK